MRNLARQSDVLIENYKVGDLARYGLGYRGWFFGPSGLTPVEEFRPAIHQPERPGRFWDATDYYNNFAFLPDTQ